MSKDDTGDVVKNDTHAHQHEPHRHHILPPKLAGVIGVTLLVFTVITVWSARKDLGALNFPLAMAIATFKASLVILYFMGLKYDNNLNRTIFFASFGFLAAFFLLTFSDLFYRGDVYVKGPLVMPTQAQAGTKFIKPWVSKPELLQHGKQLFSGQCVACHGAEGKGDGPAAASLNPKPRNFVSSDSWKNGRKPTEVFQTLTKGTGAMPSFASLSFDDRWSLVHYVLSLGPVPPTDTSSDFTRIGIDPNQTTAGGSEGSRSIPVDLAIDRMAED